MADEFIKVTKDGETIEVHPLALEDHKRLGWKVVEAEPEVEPAESSEAVESEEKTGKKPLRKRAG